METVDAGDGDGEVSIRSPVDTLNTEIEPLAVTRSKISFVFVFITSVSAVQLLGTRLGIEGDFWTVWLGWDILIVPTLSQKSVKSVPKSEAFETPLGETEASGLAVALKTDGLSGIVAARDLFRKGKVVFTF